MSLLSVAAGEYVLGTADGGWDERPARPVRLTRPVAIAARPVTSAEFAAFDPSYRRLQGSPGDDPAVGVTWDEAAAYCAWLGAREGKPFRLPTEAEWECAARLHPDALADPEAPANWCLDWYGPYPDAAQTDPVGCESGDFRVVRGGIANAVTARVGALPGERSDRVGFRVASGAPPTGAPRAGRPAPRWARDVSRERHAWTPPVPPDVPYFAEPIPYVRVPPGANGPLFARHNHDPGIAYCGNGDLLAAWYSTNEESGRELVVAAARLRRGASAWDEADLFWDAPGRNDHAPTLWNDGRGRVWHFNGLAREGGWRQLALLGRTSADDGATWSAARLLAPEYAAGNMPVSSTFRAADGTIYLPCDADPGPRGGSVLHVSRDDGDTWERRNAGAQRPTFAAGATGAWIAGIHAAVDQAPDGRLIAFGRGDDIDGTLAMSVSADGGGTWTYRGSPFPPIGGGQRAVLRRLREENALLFVSFTPGSPFTDAAGKTFTGTGLFAALSFDSGETWPVRKLLTDGRRRTLNGHAWTKTFTMDTARAEPKGYLAAVQTPDGVVHLISSGVHYRFNLAWLKTPNAAAQETTQ